MATADDGAMSCAVLSEQPVRTVPTAHWLLDATSRVRTAPGAGTLVEVEISGKKN
jgi:hypothetical protein